jgi:hypothetical protein
MRSACLAAAADARIAGEPEILGSAALVLQDSVPFGTKDPELRGLLETAVDELSDVPPGLRARVMAGLAGYLAWCEGDMAAASELQRQAVDLARESDDERAIFDAVTLRTEGETYGDRYMSADEIVELAERIGDDRAVYVALRYRQISSLRNGDRDQAEADMAALMDWPGQPTLDQANVGLAENCFALLDGRFDEAEGRAFAWLQHDASELLLAPSVTLVFVAIERGRAHAAIGLLDAMLQETPEIVGIRSALATMLAETGESDRARQHLDALVANDFAVVPRDDAWMGTLAYLANAAAIIGDRAAASAILDELAVYRQNVITLPAAIACLGATDHFRGILQLTLGRYDQAIASLAAARDVEERLRSAPRLARTKVWLADALFRAARDADRARVLISEARVVGEQLGMAWIAERCDQLAGEVGRSSGAKRA